MRSSVERSRANAFRSRAAAPNGASCDPACARRVQRRGLERTTLAKTRRCELWAPSCRCMPEPPVREQRIRVCPTVMHWFELSAAQREVAHGTETCGARNAELRQPSNARCASWCAAEWGFPSPVLRMSVDGGQRSGGQSPPREPLTGSHTATISCVLSNTYTDNGRTNC
jgi:hypothetical protein